MEESFRAALSSGKVQLAPITSSFLPLAMPSISRPSSRQVRSSRPSPPSGASHSLSTAPVSSSLTNSTRTVPLFQPPNGVSFTSLSTQTIKGYPCVYTSEYQEYYVKGMAKLEKGKGKEWSIKKREFKVMKEWEVSLDCYFIAC